MNSIVGTFPSLCAQLFWNVRDEHDANSPSNMDNVECERATPVLGGAMRPPTRAGDVQSDAPVKWRSCKRPSVYAMAVLSLILGSSSIPLACAAFIRFENCLPASTINSSPLRRLQFVPLNVSVHFDEMTESRTLNFTIYGNVTGQTTQEPYRLPNDPSWTNPNDTFGKIVDVSSNNVATTLYSRFDVLTYTAYKPDPSQFCQFVINHACPLGPDFSQDAVNSQNADDLDSLRAFSVGLPFLSSYAFSTLATTVRVLSGDSPPADLACISASVTPNLGSTIAGVLAFVPAAILALVAFATIFAAIFSPWGTSNVFRWTSNYGRDEDLLRLVTPGFGDCLQYIQFIVLSGSLSLNYPGFYQPVVSQASWSILSFNESFVSHGTGFQSLEDGIYNVNASYGLSRLRQYIGPSDDDDLWAGMAVWLVGLCVGVVVLCQVGFLIRWSIRALSNVRDGDLRNKNIPLTIGNIVRIVFNYFLLPVVALSMFQLVTAAESPASVVAAAVLLLTIVIGLAIWIFRLIFTTRPRAHLFDDLPTVLLYGPLYNTYSDDAAPFAFIPVLLTFIRGVAIGALQPSGIAQLVLLAICEVILILTLHAFRPFQAPTSMNAYHTFFSVVRLVTVLLSVAFAPPLGVTEAPKGWIGYVILFLHAIVLVFGFFLNALQSIVEVAARLAGAGGEARGGLVTVFGKRQLSKRGHRRNQRSSLNSQAAMLVADSDHKSIQLEGRTRSLSASSTILLGQSGRGSSGFDQFSQGGDYNSGMGSPGTTTLGRSTSPFTALASGGGSGGSFSRRPTLGSRPGEAIDPYYRPPRLRRPTNDLMAVGVHDHDSWTSGDQTGNPYQDSPEQMEAEDAGEGPSNRDPLAPAYLRVQREDSDTNLAERLRNTDYTVRESDFYYGVSRGPALSNLPTRRLKTGPADPTGPLASATGWVKALFGAKRKDKGKGFEVVRSTRAPPLQTVPLEEVSSPAEHEPYRDDPSLSNRGLESGRVISSDAPALAPLEAIGAIDMPSRWGSQASSRHPKASASNKSIPHIPRKSSKRTSSADATLLTEDAQLVSVVGSVPEEKPISSGSYLHPMSSGTRHTIRLPFDSTEPSPSPECSPNQGPSRDSSLHQSIQAVDDSGQLLSHVELPRLVEAIPERPLSTGYVQQHIASDSIQPGIYRLNSHLGAQAELVDDDTMKRSMSTGRDQQSVGDNNSHLSPASLRSHAEADHNVI